jgi:hydroxymethylpyrimidine pyrophosphatase-like HAD family hydrolase
MAGASIPATQAIAAVLADVDGTLLTKTKALTPRAIEAIEGLHQRGVLFAITSGRPPRGMRMLVHPLEMRGPMAAFNGGIIVQPDMTIVDERAVPADVTSAVIDTIGGHYLDVTHPTANKGVVIERLSHYYKIPQQQIATLGDQPNDVLMFRRSGLSIAMGNASEEVQREATCVTASTRTRASPRPSRSSSCRGR